MGIKRILIFLMIFITILSVPAQAAKKEELMLNFKRLTIEDGLSQSSVISVFQDSKGYMWFGTEDGLNRFDGVEFSKYRYGIEDKRSIASNWIMGMDEDDKGDLWIATAEGLNMISGSTKEIKTYTVKDNLSNNSINGICIDSNNDIIVYTEDGINLYNENKDDFIRILNENDTNTLTSQYITDIEEGSNGVYWIATDKGLNIYDSKTGEIKWFTEADENGDIIDENIITNIYIDSKDFLWICTRGGGITRINLKNWEIKKYKSNINDEDSLPSNYVTTVIRDSKDRVWIGTDSGLSQLTEDDRFITYTSKIYDTTSLVNNEILSIHEDNIGMIWVGTRKGISYFNPDGIFKTYKNDPLDPNTISGEMVFGVYEDKDGLLWIGTSSRGVNVLDRNKNIVYRLTDIEEIRSVFESHKIVDINGNGNEIWIATTEELVYINKDEKRVENFSDLENGIIRNIYVDLDNMTWISGTEGLVRIDSNHNIKDYKEEFLKNNILDEYVSVTYKDKEGYLWIGMGVNGGLIKYDESTGVMTQYKNQSDNNQSLSYNSIKAINQDGYGNVWIGTNSGLNRYNSEKDNFERYTEINGLANNFVYDILIDNNQNLWMSTNNGISLYDQKNCKFVNFDILDGLQNNEFNFNSGFVSKSGEMFFGGISGLNSFYPSEFKESQTQSDIVINKITVDGQIIDYKDEIILDYDEKNIEIEYFLPDYRNTKKVLFAYKLEGIDNEWVSGKNVRKISYTNLPSGKYILTITSKNYLGEWLPAKDIVIYKKIAPWKTSFAYIVYIIIFLILIYIIWNRVKLLDKMVKSRTDELNKKHEENIVLYNKVLENEINKNNYFVNLSHELRTPLNIILSTEQLITNLNDREDHIEKSKLSHYMQILKGNSNRLLKLINNIIDTSKIEAGEYKLELLEHNIVYHVEEIAFTMKEFIEGNGIEFIVDPQMEEKIIKCDICEIEKCLINLLGNAVKFTPENGKIEVLIDEVDDSVRILVKDTGIGIDSEDIEGIFDRFGQAYTKKSEEYGGSGLGLSLTKQLVELHGGKLLVESEVGKGSTFIIVLPAK